MITRQLIVAWSNYILITSMSELRGPIFLMYWYEALYRSLVSHGAQHDGKLMFQAEEPNLVIDFSSWYENCKLYIYIHMRTDRDIATNTTIKSVTRAS